MKQYFYNNDLYTMRITRQPLSSLANKKEGKIVNGVGATKLEEKTEAYLGGAGMLIKQSQSRRADG